MSMGRFAGKSVLVVEDEAIVAAMVEDMLTDLGASVVGPALTVAAGVAFAESEDIDAAVLDVNLAGTRIDPVAEVLRARSVPMVFATGYGQGISNLAQGAPIIDKPYTQESLAAALQRALELNAGGG